MVKRSCKVFYLWSLPAALLAVGVAASMQAPRTAAGSAVDSRQALASVPIDRWLVADPIAVEAETARAALADSALAAEASPELFPDRDIELAGAYWHLVRRDSSATFDIDSLFPQRPPVAVTYAHAYLWSAAPRTLRLRWREPECGGAVLRLNALPLHPASPEAEAAARSDAAEGGGAEGGDAVDGDGAAVDGADYAAPGTAMLVRLVGGWNTLLVEVAAGDCAYPLEVRLETGGVPTEVSGSAAPADLSGLRVQASRPPGVRRVYPDASVTVGDPRVVGPLTWPAGLDELAADVWLELASWGAPALVVQAGEAEASEAERARDARPRPAPGRRPPGQAAGDPPEPPSGGPDQESERERLADLRARLLPEPPPPQPAPARAELEAKAGGEEVRRTVELEEPGRARGLALAFPLGDLGRAARSSGMELELRWTVDGREGRLEGRLALPEDAALGAPDRAIELDGWTETGDGSWGGEWRVPQALSGSTLELWIEGAEGRWTVNGREVSPGPSIPLCGPCSAGTRIRLEVAPASDPGAPPRVRVRRA